LQEIKQRKIFRHEIAKESAPVVRSGAVERTSETEKLRYAAESANRAKDEFISTLSHELRTPLNAIIGWVRVVQFQKDEPATVGRALEAIGRNAEAQAHIIEDLLDISRIVTGKMRLELTLIDLPSFIDECVDAIRPAAQAKRIAVTPKITTSLEQLLGDRGRLQQVMWNLLSNAIPLADANLSQPPGSTKLAPLAVALPSQAG
jgi:signal transduction histidine kinase